MMKDDLGDRMKEYEAQATTPRLDPSMPIYARIDGRSFSRFTNGMKRPYDEAMKFAMHNVTCKLVEHTNAVIGYTQSDEISLVWNRIDSSSEFMFNGKIQKLNSILAGMATSYFILECAQEEHLFNRALSMAPHFDCRVMNLPSEMEAMNMLYWRELDAQRNSVSMAARAHFSHKSLQGKDVPAMKAMLLSSGIDWDEYPESFKRGTYFKKHIEYVNDFDNIPEQYRPTEPVARSRYKASFKRLTSFKETENRINFVFGC